MQLVMSNRKIVPLLLSSVLVTGAMGCGGSPGQLPDAGPLVDGHAVAVAYGLNDVSVLFPLPTSLDDTNALSFSSAGNGGPLFSTDMFDAISVFQEGASNGSGGGGSGGAAADVGATDGSPAYDTWRIVAARIDPCFPDLGLLATDPSTCRRQLRLVAQPLADLDNNGVPAGFGADDDAIHLLYDLSESDFTAMAQRFLAVRTSATSDSAVTLGIHPVIAQQGLAGAVATELRATILAYAGSATLSQYTFLQGREVAWQFGGFKVNNGVRTAIAIAGIGTSDPDAGTVETTTSDFDGIFDVTPPSPAFMTLSALVGMDLDDGGSTAGNPHLTASSSDIAKAMQSTFDLETPAKFNADTLDCSTCHLAGRARERAISLGASQSGLTHFTDDPFDLDLTIDDSFKQSPQQQRAFGFRGTDAVWNQRVINESAAVAAQLAILLPPAS